MGLYGATFAQQARRHGKSVLVIDKRDHIAGNVHTEKDRRHQLSQVWCTYFPH